MQFKSVFLFALPALVSAEEAPAFFPDGESNKEFMKQLSKAQVNPFTIVSDNYSCPGSSAWFHHAKCQMKVAVKATCTEVSDEVNARLTGQEGWFDQHNKGIYKLISNSNNGSLIKAQRETGDKKFTDKMNLSLVDTGNGVCEVYACSESQVTSVLDFSTNFCNLYLLLCGSVEGCKYAKHDFAKLSAQYDDCTQNDFSKCLAVPASGAEQINYI